MAASTFSPKVIRVNCKEEPECHKCEKQEETIYTGKNVAEKNVAKDWWQTNIRQDGSSGPTMYTVQAGDYLLYEMYLNRWCQENS